MNGFTARDGDGAQGGMPIDLSAWAENGVISFDIKLLEAGDPVATVWQMKVESENAATFAQLNLAGVPELDTWKNFTVKLSDLAAGGLDLSSVDLIMIFRMGNGSGW